MNKKELGQFMTTNFKYILQNLKIPEETEIIIEPFCGHGDLLNFLDKKKHKIECYDIEPKSDFIEKRNILENPPIYKNKFVLTNPPYLAKNKSLDKNIFNQYDTDDLYKCFIKQLIKDNPIGGILIVPLNFWSSIRKKDIELRKSFLERFYISQLNVFEERVFEDTSYTVCSFQFNNSDIRGDININIYPQNINFKVSLNSYNNFTIGGEIYNLKSSKYKITRLTNKNQDKKNTNILAKCIDDNKNNRIKLSLVDDKNIYIDQTPKLSSRTYATLIITPEISKEKQLWLTNQFNKFLNINRQKYHSLFLTNYRESKDIARKRISFELIYKIVGWILEQDDISEDLKSLSIQ